MRINKLDNIFQVYNKSVGSNKIKFNGSAKEKDELKISDKGVEFQFALQKVRETTDIRMEKVEGLKQQVQAGTYDVSGKEIAEKIIASVNFDKKI